MPKGETYLLDKNYKFIYYNVSSFILSLDQIVIYLSFLISAKGAKSLTYAPIVSRLSSPSPILAVFSFIVF